MKPDPKNEYSYQFATSEYQIMLLMKVDTREHSHLM